MNKVKQVKMKEGAGFSFSGTDCLGSLFGLCEYSSTLIIRDWNMTKPKGACTLPTKYPDT